MKIWSMPHSDMGKTVQNYNRPKVSESPLQAGVTVAPPSGDAGECSWLFAGKPGVSDGTRHSSGSDNPISVWSRQGATPENQQETA